MPEPLAGRTVIAEFVNAIEAHLAVAALRAHGIDATLLSDPRDPDGGLRQIGSSGLGVVVLEADETIARRVLDEIDDDLPAEFHDDEVNTWSAAIDDRDRAKRERSRRTTTAVIVVLFVVVLAALLVGAALTLLG